MARRAPLIPWKVAGRVTDTQQSADHVVRTTGWVFNNETGEDLTLDTFVASGAVEVARYLYEFGLSDGEAADRKRSLVEIGAGIGRMTCEFTRRFGTVYACDLDAGFLERCREAVGRYGRVDRLRTVEVADGRTLALPDGIADVVFSYITLQHCARSDALSLIREAVRVSRPGGMIALNFRSRSVVDAAVMPLATFVRGVLGVPVLGDRLSRHRLPTRVAWQVNRLDPHHVLAPIADDVVDVTIWRNPARTAPMFGVDGAAFEFYDVVNPNHWWLVARRAAPAAATG
jgi:SAM-dependent methyltransferase